MSITLATARAAVYQLIRDVDRSAPAVRGYIIDQALSNRYQLTGARVYGVPFAWTTLAALVAGTATYTLTGAAAREFHTLGMFRLASDLRPLEKISPVELEPLRQGTPSQSGAPIALSVTEAPPAAAGTTETTFTVWPTPAAADTLQGLGSTTPGVLTADADLMQAGSFIQRAVEYGAAAELLFAMPTDTAARLQINPAVGQKYADIAEQFIEWEQTRLSRERSARLGNRSQHRGR